MKIRQGTNVLLTTVAALCILFMVNYLSMRHYSRADWTDSGLYTLSDKSQKVLEVLARDVKIARNAVIVDPGIAIEGLGNESHPTLDGTEGAQRKTKKSRSAHPTPT